jgi:hypothetical protein
MHIGMQSAGCASLARVDFAWPLASPFSPQDE